MKSRLLQNTCLKLFITFLRLGAFTFGGGYAMLPLIKRDIVEKENWLDEGEFLDALTISQSVPGAVAINTAIYTGYKIKGTPGAFVCLLGVIIPSFTIILLIAMYFLRFQEVGIVNKAFMGIRPGVVGLIFAAVISIGKPILTQKKSIIIFLAAFFLAVIGLHPIGVIVAFGVLAFILNKGEKKHKEDKEDEDVKEDKEKNNDD
ncbi:chromate transporter [Natranaerofaba carboxydovora]|uniref:chromate transporter n=1 Tax=Natranaerofaba carboxydovora TaxID=2742683 RepID=UPI001F135C19|nr:chromate transporter [Natranaerofaba carboxydovora]UMZ75429.1 Chromate transport protein [Natranaerofaba carboxydovora]